MLLQHRGKQALLTGDGFPTDIHAGVRRIAGENEQLALDAFKVPHHGSRFNVSPGLLRALDCKLHMFSSNGSRTKHPHAESVARVLSSGGEGQTLMFNYQTAFNEIWDDDQLRGEFEFETVYPSGPEGVAVTLG